MTKLDAANTDALISAACKAAEEGMFVFPVNVHPSKDRPGKHDKEPICASWTGQSTDDPEQVVRFNWSRATHFGIDCGKSSVWVVDIDNLSCLSKLPLSPTRVQETISGGLHYIYKANPKLNQRNTTGIPMPGVDIRANGGFIVWYGIGEMIADTIRGWPFTSLVEAAKGARPVAVNYQGAAVSHGGRNNDAISAAGNFMARFPTASLDMVVPFLVGHSALFHSPPLEAGELRKIATSAMRWRKEDSEIKAEEYYGRISDMPHVPAPRALCGDWLREKTLSMLYARAGVGKTAWLAELCWSLKMESEFLGMPCQRVERILWINGDLPAWQIHERLGYLDPVVDLWHVMFDDLMLRQEDVYQRCQGYDAVIFDNRPSLFDLGDANTAEAWKPLMNLFRQVSNSGPAVIVATHEGKGEGTSSSFGSSAQEWAIDNNIRLTSLHPSDADEKKYVDFCYGKIPTGRMTFHKHRMCAKPDDRDFYLSMVNFADNLVARRLVFEWKCFYSANGKQLVRRTNRG